MIGFRAALRIKGSLLGFLLASYLTLAVVPVALFGVVGGFLLFSTYRQDIKTVTRVSVRSAVAEAERYVAGPKRLVESLASSFRGSIPKEHAEAFLGAAQAGSIGVRALALLDRRYRVIAAAPAGAMPAGADLSRRAFIEEARLGETVLSKPFVNPATGGVDAAIVRVEGDFTVVGILELDALSAFLRPLRFSSSDQVAIVDEAGFFIAHTDERRVQERQREALSLDPDGEAKQTIREGRSYLLARSDIRGTKWAVVYYRDLTAAAAFAVAFGYRFLALLAALALTAAVFIALARRAFELRLKALLDRIRDVERGSWLASSGVSDSWREFRKIGEAFALMAERVAEREEDLRRSEEKYRGLFVRNKAPTLIVDGGSGRIVDANPAAALFYGMEREALLAMNIQEINTLDPDEIAAEMAEAEEERRSHFHFRHKLADGQLRDVEVYSSPVEWEGARRLYSIIIDVTERSLAEKRVERSLAEKEVLLREIHHRVKNNLQIMASLLNLQALYVRDPADADLFRSSQDRILSMAAIHELLYQRDDLAAVDLGEYLRSLVSNLSETAAHGCIKVSVEAERAETSPEKALPLGLIMNELVTNSIKYAFPLQVADSNQRSIVVSLHRKDDQIELEIRDNGVGLPSDMDPDRASSLGFSLVRSLSSQLGGRVTYRRTDGFSVVITAPL